MPKYHILAHVERATGTQLFEVEAASKAEALAIYHAGEGRCIEEELEVEKIGDVECLGLAPEEE